MSDYTRTTRECTFDQLRPELQAAIRERAEQKAMGDLAATATIVCETTSEKKKSGLLGKLRGGASIQYTAMALTPKWLVWVATDDKGQAGGVMWARLTDITVTDYAVSPNYKLMPDSGVEVFGLLAEFPERARAFIGLGSEPAAVHFKEAVTQAVATARG
jgi:hypothetical protein